VHPLYPHLHISISDDDPHTALSHYQHAIDILAVQLKGKEPADNSNTRNDDSPELKVNIVRSYVRMVEIWMDLSYDLW